MIMQDQLIEKKLNELPDNLKKEVLDFIDFLMFKSRKSAEKEENKEFIFDWEGGMADYKEKYDSVKLQHLSQAWR